LNVSECVLKRKKNVVIESKVLVSLSPFTFFSRQKWMANKARNKINFLYPLSSKQ